MATVMLGDWLLDAGTWWLPVLLDASVKGLVLLALAWAAARLMRRASASARHVVWCLARLAKRLQAEAEAACDDLVFASGHKERLRRTPRAYCFRSGCVSAGGGVNQSPGSTRWQSMATWLQ